MDNNCKMKNIKECKEYINHYDSLLIVAGAGLGIDSGLPDYRGPQGLWNTWHPARHLNMTYENLSTHELFLENPALAWGFHTFLTKIYYELDPHQGYFDLLNICKHKFNDNYFVLTSNVDSQFLKSGFDENKLYEVHGTKRLWQCTNKNCNKMHYPWLMNIDDLPRVDDKTLTAMKPFPKCKYCDSMARPNVSFFGDYFFNEKICKKQSLKLFDWLEKNKGRKLLIMELGCGVSKHSVRFMLKDNQYSMMSNEWKLPKSFLANHNTKLIRINPDDEDDCEGVIKINFGAKKALRLLSSK
jgi:NAD-dependent SIR2 family protein deacetylase